MSSVSKSNQSAKWLIMGALSLVVAFFLSFYALNKASASTSSAQTSSNPKPMPTLSQPSTAKPSTLPNTGVSLINSSLIFVGATAVGYVGYRLYLIKKLS